MYPGAGPVDPMAYTDAPLAMRMMEHLPGATASLLFAQARGANTIMAGGGFMDFNKASEGVMNRHRVINQSGRLSDRRATQFLGSSSRRASASARVTAGVPSMNFGYSSRVNHATMRPRALRRLHSLSVFSNTNVTGAYTPFSASVNLNRMPGIGSKITSAMSKFSGIDDIAAADVGPGLFSFSGAARRADMLEAKALKQAQRGQISGRVQKRLAKFDRSLDALHAMNGDPIKVVRVSQAQAMPFSKAVSMTPLERGGMTASEFVRANSASAIKYDDLGYAATRNTLIGTGIGPMPASSIGMRGDLLMSQLPGRVTQTYGGYMRYASGYGANITSAAGLEGVNKARTAMQSALDDLGIKAKADDVLMAKKRGGQGLIKSVGGSKNAAALMKTPGARGVLATRGAMAALPGLQALGTASLLYDLGKMAGEVVVSGINLAKDAYKSVQGTINKPAFGMGYQDTEAAATSRARGVMAIQNSRLNARSVLGSEGAMMAAHFG
jgi:hypothetical protein